MEAGRAIEPLQQLKLEFVIERRIKEYNIESGGSAIVAFCSKTGNFFLSFSMHTTGFAPRDAASSPIIPEPEKRSQKEKPVRSPSTANTDSRIRSMAGRILRSLSGILTIRPLYSPPVMRICNYQSLSLKSRRISRSMSRAFISARLSNSFLPRHRPSSSFTRPCFKYMLSGTSV